MKMTGSNIQEVAKERMHKTIHALEQALSKLRAGRATPTILEGLQVTYYGAQTPLSQLASITVEGPFMLLVKPWEKKLVSEIEKAIRTSDLGLNPATAGDIIRVPLPPLSEERRKELIKKVKTEVEEAKVAVRNIRRDCNQDCKEQLKKKQMSEDEERRLEEGIQKLTNTYIEKIESIFSQKEKDLLEI